mgnify:CR=1 FL=1
MSKFLDRFRYFKQKGETFADGHGQLLNTNRDWEDGYRQRWQHDKIVRSTHRICQTMNLAAARAVPATPGIFTVPTA